MELWKDVPANWIVLVVGAIVDCAFAEKVANAIKITRQNKTAAEFSRKTGLLCANTTAVIEGLTLAFPSRKPWLPRSLSDIQEGIIHSVARLPQHGADPEVLRNHRLQQPMHLHGISTANIHETAVFPQQRLE